jgi:hypothetical protein
VSISVGLRPTLDRKVLKISVVPSIISSFPVQCGPRRAAGDAPFTPRHLSPSEETNSLPDVKLVRMDSSSPAGLRPRRRDGLLRAVRVPEGAGWPQGPPQTLDSLEAPVQPAEVMLDFGQIGRGAEGGEPINVGLQPHQTMELFDDQCYGRRLINVGLRPTLEHTARCRCLSFLLHRLASIERARRPPPDPLGPVAPPYRPRPGRGATHPLIAPASHPRGQGLTLVHFSPQRKRFLWERGCIYGICKAV